MYDPLSDNLFELFYESSICGSGKKISWCFSESRVGSGSTNPLKPYYGAFEK